MCQYLCFSWTIEVKIWCFLLVMDDVSPGLQPNLVNQTRPSVVVFTEKPCPVQLKDVD